MGDLPATAFIEHPDYMALRDASMDQLVAALHAVSHGIDDPALPRATRQVAETILGRAVRIVRTGTLDEALDATLSLSGALMGSLAQVLGERDPDALKLVSAAELTLAAAYAPDSEAGQVPVLRKWNGRAVDVVALLQTAKGNALPRAELRERLRVDDESHLSHILRDLEVAGLIRRSRSGRSVTVHLGPTVSDEAVQEAIRARQQNWRSVIRALECIAARDLSNADVEALEALTPVREHLEQFLRGSDDGPRVERASVTIEHLECFRDSLIFGLRAEGYQLRDRAPGRASTTISGSAVWRLRMLAGQIVDVERWAPFFVDASASWRPADRTTGRVLTDDRSPVFTYLKEIDVIGRPGSREIQRIVHTGSWVHVEQKDPWEAFDYELGNHFGFSLDETVVNREDDPLIGLLNQDPKRLSA